MLVGFRASSRMPTLVVVASTSYHELGMLLAGRSCLSFFLNCASIPKDGGIVR